MLQQQQDQLLNAANSQKIQQQITALQWPYQTRLRQIQRRVTPAVIYTQLSYLAKAHHLQLLQLKPQKYPLVSGWNQIIFTLDLNGSEANALDFLRLSMHQTWLTQYQKIEFSSLKNRVLVHLTLAIYYVGV